MDRCINCGIATGRCNTLGKRALDEEATLSVIRKWRASETVSTYLHNTFTTGTIIDFISLHI